MRRVICPCQRGDAVSVRVFDVVRQRWRAGYIPGVGLVRKAGSVDQTEPMLRRLQCELCDRWLLVNGLTGEPTSDD